MINPKDVCLYIPPGLQKFKLDLFNRIGGKIKKAGGDVAHSVSALQYLPNEFVPVIGCSPELTPFVKDWNKTGRKYIYWDRGYMRRVFATHLPRGENGGFYRWHVNSFQMTEILDVPWDRMLALKYSEVVKPWNKGGKHIVLARPTDTYSKFHDLGNWTDRTIYALSLVTDRPILVRDKETRRDLAVDCSGAHALVSHASIAAVEAVILGCPVFVDPASAAALVGRTEIKDIEKPVYPDREGWLNSLAYCQFNENELVDGTLWRLLQ